MREIIGTWLMIDDSTGYYQFMCPRCSWLAPQTASVSATNQYGRDHYKAAHGV